MHKFNNYQFLFLFIFCISILLSGVFHPHTAEAKVNSITGRYVIADIVDKISPGVVNINTMIKGHSSSGTGGASGFIVSKKGYILTNHHVIKNAQQISVTLTNGLIIKNIKKIGSDSLTDIAVLQIPQPKLPDEIPVIELGNSNKLRVGEWVIAIGNPFSHHLGNKPTISAGIISTLNRNIETKQRTYKNFIQTDAPINPGNSGGPLVNLDGKVIGINTAIIPYARGIGFAIPINKAKDIMNKLIKYGKVNRPCLGVKVVPASLFKKGALIKKVLPNSPAEKANLKKNDIIIEINKYPVTNAKDFEEIKQKLEVGEKIKIEILRNGIKNYLVVKVGQYSQK